MSRPSSVDWRCEVPMSWHDSSSFCLEDVTSSSRITNEASTPMATSISETVPTQETSKVAITNVRVFDGKRISAITRTVIIDSGVIAEDTNSEGATLVDGQGSILLPGFIDAHIHLRDENDLRQMSKFGVTTGLDMATWPPEKLAPLRGRTGMTDIRSPGLPATSPGSVHSHFLPLSEQDLVASSEAAAQFVEKRVFEGADYIKIIADVPGPDQATLDALVDAAHQKHKLVIAHAATVAPYAMSQKAKADIITHAPLDEVLDSDAVALMVSGKRIAVPTLTMMEGLSKPFGLLFILKLLLRPFLLLALIKHRYKSPSKSGSWDYQHAKDSVTAMYRAGVPVLAGTDSNTEESSPFQVKHGDALHHELELLVDAGLSTVDTLRAATCLPAEHFGLHDRGMIQAGKRADLVLVSDDPIHDIRASRSIQRVWCAGIEVDLS